MKRLNALVEEASRSCVLAYDLYGNTIHMAMLSNDLRTENVVGDR